MKVNWKESKTVLNEPKRTHEKKESNPHDLLFSLAHYSSKIAQYEQELKHLHHEMRSKEVFLTKVIQLIISIHFFRKTLELEEELKVVGNNMKSLEVSEQEVVRQNMFMPNDLILRSPVPRFYFYHSYSFLFFQRLCNVKKVMKNKFEIYQHDLKM